MEQDYLIDDGLVERLHAALADALKRTRTEPFTTPVTVAEIYQDLVPYRVVRSVLGFQMNADYEHTLLRLLAGEAGLARLEPAEARDELTTELETSNPNVGLFRKFAACDVWIEPSDMSVEIPGQDLDQPAAAQPVASPPEAMTPPAPPPTPVEPTRPEPVRSTQPEPDPAPVAPVEPPAMVVVDADIEVLPVAGMADLPQLDIPDDLSGQQDGAWQDDLVIWAEPEPEGQWEAAEGELLLEEEVQAQESGPDTPRDPAAAGNDETRQQREAAVMFDSNQSQASVATMAGGTCPYCQGSLPAGRTVRFCQSCGADQSTRPCPSCREPLDPNWKFCIGCGHQQS